MRRGRSGRFSDGFSLTEVTVTVMLIGVLAAIVVPKMLGPRETAKNTEAVSSLQLAFSTARSYLADNRSYDGLCADDSGSTCNNKISLHSLNQQVKPDELDGDAAPSDALGASEGAVWLGSGTGGSVSPDSTASAASAGVESDPTGRTIVLCSLREGGDTVYCIKDDKGTLSYARVQDEDITVNEVVANDSNFKTGVDLNGKAIAGTSASGGVVDAEVDSPPSLVANPMLTGQAVVGQTMLGSPGSWKGSPTPSYTYQWKRCDTQGQNCVPITGATSSAYTLVSGDLGKTVRMETTATNVAGTGSGTSDPSAVVEASAASLSAPALQSDPSFSGRTIVGSVLTADPGSWSGEPQPEFAYQWRRCDLSGSSCNPIPSANGSTYTLGSLDAGTTIRLRVTATNSEGSASANSAPGGPISSPPVNSALPSISGSVAAGRTIAGDVGSWTGYPEADYTFQWLRCDAAGDNCQSIAGATGSEYTVAEEDAGNKLRLRVTASNVAGSSSATSTATSGVEGAPVNTAAPEISGEATLGATLTATPGSWSGTPSPEPSYQWQRCTLQEDGTTVCTNISLATTSTYKVTRSDGGDRLRVRVTASNPNGAASSTSASTGRATTPPLNTDRPVLSGTTKIGDVVSVTNGVWDDYPDSGFEREWFRCDSSGSPCTPISGEVGTTHTIVAADSNKILRVKVTASNSVGSDWVYSNDSSLVVNPPVNISPPTISGTPRVGQVLSGAAGSWSNEPEEYLFQWQSCTDEEGCRDIAGANGQTYTPVDGDTGKGIRLLVVASNPSGSAQSGSTISDPVLRIPKNNSPPVITGEANRGQTLTADPGNWLYYPAVTYDYQWVRCASTDGGNTWTSCINIPSAINSSYTLTSDDVSKKIKVQVTARNSEGATSKESSLTSIVGSAPVNTELPQITGIPKVGNTLTGTNGTWAAYPAAGYTYQWQRCNLQGGSCGPIDNAINLTYDPVRDDAGSKLRLTVTAKNSAGTAEATSNASAAVTALPWNKAPPTVSGNNAAGQTLSSSPGSWGGYPDPTVSPNELKYQWQRCPIDGNTSSCSNISGATEPSYILTQQDGGSRIRSRVTATNSEGAVSSFSDLTEAVTAPPVASAVPVVTGQAKVGQTLTSSQGSWTGYPAPTYTYNWQYSETGTGGWLDVVPPAVTSSYLVPSTYAGKYLRAQVIATNRSGSATASSVGSGPVIQDPSNLTLPSISGNIQVAQTLTANPGTWDGYPAPAYTYQWEFSETGNPNSWNPIPSANQLTYVLSSTYSGQYIRVTVTATNTAGSAAASSPAEFVPGLPVNSSPPTISGTAQVGLTLSGAPGSWSGSQPILYAYTWQVSETGAPGTWLDIVGAPNASSYAPTSAEGSKYVRLKVTASNSFGASEAFSASSDQVMVPPANTSPPALSGGTEIGSTFTSTSGSWTGTPLVSTGIKWQRSGNNSSWSYISGALTSSLTVPAQTSWIGDYVRSEVTGSNAAGSLAVPSESARVTGLVNTSAPVISGTARVGQVLSVSNGTWASYPAASYAYRWQTSDNGSSGWTTISGAGGSTFTIPSSQAGKYLRAQVVANNNTSPEAITPSLATAQVTDPPALVSAPTLSGGMEIGSTVATSDGTWSGFPTPVIAYKWQESSNGSSWNYIPSALTASHTISSQSSWIGRYVRAEVTASNSAGSVVTPTSSARVTGLVNSAAPTLSGSARLGQTLSIAQGTWASHPAASYDYKWQRSNDGSTGWADISGTSGSTYTLTSADVGKYVRGQVLATNGTSPAVTVPTSSSAQVSEPPTNTAAPTLSGGMEIGSTVSGSNGTWSGFPAPTYTYQWQSSSDNSSWTNIVGAPASASYAIPSASATIGTYLRLQVTATNSTGSDTVPSASARVTGLVNSAAPAISGTAAVGQALTASQGSWASNPAASYSYKWQRSANGTSGWADIASATSSSYTLTASDAGQYVRAQVIATNGTSPAVTASSVSSSQVVQLPTNTAVPVVSGTARVGQTLTGTNGTWQAFPTATYSYQWQESVDGTNWTNIASATSSSYALAAAQAGDYVRLQVTATNASGPTTASSAATSQVTQVPTNTAVPALSGTERVGNTMTSSQGSWQGFPTPSYTYQWQISTTDPNLVADPGYATGGTVTTYWDSTAQKMYRVHRFTSSGTLTVNQAISGGVDYLVVGGGGGGGSRGGGGGAGGLLSGNTSVSSGAYSVTVGSGGAIGSTADGATGGGSSALGFNALGGGGGGGFGSGGLTGGSGGGAGNDAVSRTGANGTAGQGSKGGNNWPDALTANRRMGGGGGSGAVGANATSTAGGAGGAGTSSSITGTATFYAAGGGGGTEGSSNPGAGGSSIGGTGGTSAALGTAGAANTGSGGGGGAGGDSRGGAGGSGVVIVRYEIPAWSNISAATSSNYIIQSGDLGKYLRTNVTATNSEGSATASSASSSIVASAPVNTVLPTIGGTAEVGQILSTAGGTWTGTPTPALTYQWQRCDIALVATGCVNIAGATSSSYTAVSADSGSRLRLQVTGTNVAGAVTATTAMTSIVPGGGGGTVTTSGNFRIHSFTSTGSSTFSAYRALDAEYLIVAGGGGGGQYFAAGGGGAGGVLSGSLNIAAGSYSLSVGSGGLGATVDLGRGSSGGNSTFAGFTATGGGGGGGYNAQAGLTGGSGGGGGAADAAGSVGSGGTGTSGQGNSGGNGVGSVLSGSVYPTAGGGGGGGGGGSGATATSSGSGAGGAGITSSISGSSQGYAGGGGGGGFTGAGGSATAGGGAGGAGNNTSGSDATANTGGGGGGAGGRTGASQNKRGGNGGSGVVIIRYPEFQAPANTALPTVSGTVRTTQTLTATSGTWNGFPVPSYTYQWQSSANGTSGWSDISGATSSTYAVPESQAGNYLRVIVTATNSITTASATSAATTQVLQLPQPGTAPAISGTVKAGQSLASTNGTWTGVSNSFTYTYQWQRTPSGQSSWADIASATSASYTLQSADGGYDVRLRVTATNSAGSVTNTSNTLGPVAATPVNTNVPAISGLSGVGSTLTATSGVWLGFPFPTYDYQWQSSGPANFEYLVIGGGGGGGGNGGGGGGAGGYRTNVVGETSGGGSAAEPPLSLSQGTYPVTVGAGASAAGPANGIYFNGGNGADSSFAGVTSTGGGGGSASGNNISTQNGRSGGSGGGASSYTLGNGTGGSGTAGQGYAGGNSPAAASNWRDSGGGGAGGVGGVSPSAGVGGVGGAGLTSSITGSAVTRASGGSGYFQATATAGGGAASGGSGAANTGGGGGGGTTANGGSGIVVVRYPVSSGVVATGGTITTPTIGGVQYKVHTFTSSGSFVVTDTGGWTDIPGATSSTYVPQISDLNRYLRVKVTAANSEGSVSATSASQQIVAPPANTILPTISGTLTPGQTITTTTGTWTSNTTPTYAYQWVRCDETGANCSDIAGATSQNYTLGVSDAAKTMRVRVTASNAAGPGSSASSAVSSPVASASGGTITTSGSWRIHTFYNTGSSTFTPYRSTDVEYLVVGGGGGGGMDMGGGGGGGGFLEGTASLTANTNYSVTVGAGGTGGPAGCSGSQPCAHQFTQSATNGGNSSLSGGSLAAVTAIGGGRGGSSYYDYTPGAGGANGGSGGGTSGYSNGTTRAGGTGTSGQGFNGGQGGGQYYSGGGGGAGGAGTSSTSVAHGGPGKASSILGTTYFFAGGGGGSGYSICGGNGGIGGGGGGAICSTTGGGSALNSGAAGGGGGGGVQANVPGGNAGANTGGGGGGGSHYNSNNKGGEGGSGIVVIRYQDYAAPANSAVPTVSGTVRSGQTLTAATGTWTGFPTPTYTYQWQTSNDGSSGWADISGATSSTYSIPTSQIQKYLRVRVTATNSLGSASASSAATTQVQQTPVNTAAPAISGTARVGQTLTASNGTWDAFPTPPTYTYQWQVSPDGGSSWNNIADGGTFTEYSSGITASSGPHSVTRGPDDNIWFTQAVSGRIARVTPSGTVTEFVSPTASPNLGPITAGPDNSLWYLTGVGKVGKLTTSGTFTEFDIPSGFGNVLGGIAAGPDGNLWITGWNSSNRVARMTPDGKFTEFSPPTSGSCPGDIAAGPDGNMWFVEYCANKIAKLDPSTGDITEYTIPTANSGPVSITSGPDGNMWFTSNTANRIGKVTTGGSFTEYSTGITASSNLREIVSGPDGAMWFTGQGSNRVGRITTSGTVTEYAVPTASSQPYGLALGADDRLWFTQFAGNKIGAVTAGASTASSYTVEPGDAGRAIRVQVTATNSAGAATAASTATSAVEYTPTNTAIPSVSQTPVGGWTPNQAEVKPLLWTRPESLSNRDSAEQIGYWKDSSGNGNAFTQSTAASRPTWTPNAINGYGALQFTAASSTSGQAMTNNTNFDAPYTLMYVGRLNGSVNQRLLGAVTNNWLLGYHSGTQGDLYTDGWVNDSATAATQNWIMWGASGNGSTNAIYQNGSLLASNSGGTTGPNGPALGCGNPGAATECSTGQVAEVIAVKDNLSTAERQKLEGYLAWKYNLQSSLPASHPFRNAAPGSQGTSYSTTNGTWSGSPAPSYTYQWQRCTSQVQSSSCSNIAGATSSSYTRASADGGTFLRARVTATNSVGAATANSAMTSQVEFPAPSASDNPSIAASLTTAPRTWVRADSAQAPAGSGVGVLPDESGNSNSFYQGGANRSYAEEVMRDNPLGFYRLDETSGTTYSDSSGNGLNLTGASAAALTTNGPSAAISDRSISIGGAFSNRVSRSAPISNAVSSFTLEAWIYPTAASQASTIIMNGSGNNSGYALGINGTDGVSGNCIGGLFGGVQWVNSGWCGFAANTWYHVAMTRDGSNVRFYVNGSQVGNTVATASPGAMTTSSVFSIGATGTDRPFAGRIAYAALYPRQLPGGRIAEHYRGALRPTMVSSGVGSKPTMRFDGVNDFLDSTRGSYSTPMTVMAVASRPSAGTTTDRILHGLPGGDQNLFFGTISGNFATFTGSGAAWNDTATNSPSTPVASSGSLLAMTTNGTTLTPYVNGTAQTTKTGSMSTFTGMRMGAMNVTTQQWNGDISEVVIFPSVLSQADRESMEGYLAWKYGLQASLPAAHPFRNSAPNISGSLMTGRVLLGYEGAWNNMDKDRTARFEPRWYRCDSAQASASSTVPANCTQTKSDEGVYTTDNSDTGKHMVYGVTATNSGGSAEGYSASAGPVGRAPLNTSPPTTGSPVVGDPLSSSAGTWIGSPTPSLTYQWQSEKDTASIEYLVVAGGGAGGGRHAGGGGGGGVLTGTTSISGSQSVTVGSGGSFISLSGYGGIGGNGGNSAFGSVSATGGGGGGGFADGVTSGGVISSSGRSGGSGGGAATSCGLAGGCATGPGSGAAGQGNSGGSGVNNWTGGGGGGANQAGGNASGSIGGKGGDGISSSITGSALFYGGGGGGAGEGNVDSNGGAGGAGGGGRGTGAYNPTQGVAGTANTGGGGGGSRDQAGASGGSGVVIVRYPTSSGIVASGGTESTITSGGVEYKVHRFTSSSTFTLSERGYDDIAGATSLSYTPSQAQVGKRLRLRVTATNSNGSSSANSSVSATTSQRPANTAAPAISGNPADGDVLTATTGTWTGTPTPTYSYQWQSSSDGGTSWSNIAGATASTYTVAAADSTRLIRAQITATNSAGSATASSNNLGPVVLKPTVTWNPTPTTPVSNGTSTVATTWTLGGGAATSVQCSTDGTNWSNCATTTSNTFSLGGVCSDTTLRVRATNAGGSNTITRTVHRNCDPPTISITSSPPHYFYTSGTYNYSHSNATSCTINITAAPWGGGNQGTWNCNLNNVSSGNASMALDNNYRQGQGYRRVRITVTNADGSATAFQENDWYSGPSDVPNGTFEGTNSGWTAFGNGGFTNGFAYAVNYGGWRAQVWTNVPSYNPFNFQGGQHYGRCDNIYWESQPSTGAYSVYVPANGYTAAYSYTAYTRNGLVGFYQWVNTGSWSLIYSIWDHNSNNNAMSGFSAGGGSWCGLQRLLQLQATSNGYGGGGGFFDNVRGNNN